jgi:hypothetical protein
MINYNCVKSKTGATQLRIAPSVASILVCEANMTRDNEMCE